MTVINLKKRNKQLVLYASCYYKKKLIFIFLKYFRYIVSVERQRTKISNMSNQESIMYDENNSRVREVQLNLSQTEFVKYYNELKSMFPIIDLDRQYDEYQITEEQTELMKVMPFLFYEINHETTYQVHLDEERAEEVRMCLMNNKSSYEFPTT